MITRLSGWLIRVSSTRLTLIALVIFILFTALVLPKQASQAERAAAGAGTPDLSMYYTAGELYRMAESYGEAGRAAYVQARFTFDLAWPLVYTFFLVTALSWLFSRAFPSGSSWLYANIAPLIAMLLDYAENISTSIVMLRYPQSTPILAEIAGAFTLAKWVFVSLSFILLVCGIIAYFYRRLRGASDEIDEI